MKQRKDTGTTRMTQQRRETLAWLGNKRSGATTAAMSESLGIKPVACVARLGDLLRIGMVCRVGISGPMVRWCLPEFESATKGSYARVGTPRQRADRRRNVQARALQVKQRVVSAKSARRIDIPAVNSVWSLAA